MRTLAPSTPDGYRQRHARRSGTLVAYLRSLLSPVQKHVHDSGRER